MPAQKLIRWSGFALMLGGITLVIHYGTHPPGETAHYTFEPLWGFSHWMGAFAWLAILFGLFGLYAREGQRIGRLGLVGFVMAAAGGALSAGTLMVGGAVLSPIMGAGAPELLELDGPLFTSTGLKAAAALILAGLVGLLLLAIAVLRARALPPIGSWILIAVVPTTVVAVPFLLVAPELQGIVQILLLGLLTGAGLFAWGFALSRELTDMPAAPEGF